MYFSPAAGLLQCLTCLVLVSLLTKRLCRYPLLQGPRGLPFIGNALQMPLDREWLKFTEWAKTYGDIVHLAVFGRSIMVLNSPEVILELLEKRGNLYSDHPTSIMAGEMIGYARYMVLEPYSERLREGRKILLSNLNTRKMPGLQWVQASKVIELLLRLLRAHADFRLHLRLFASVVFQITHGHDVEDFDDPVIKLAETVTEEYSLSLRPGAYLVDSFPFLRYVPDWSPGAGFKAVAKARRKTLQTTCDVTYDIVKQQIAHGTVPPSITASLIESNSSPAVEEEDLIKTTTATFYGAGADTSVSALVSFFLIMTLYPEVQRKAQAELDSVVEPGCLPKFSDRPRLPCIEALMKEIHRWNPVSPLGVPHKSTQDDVYKGLHIPAGSSVIANTWAVLHDPSLYPSPFEVIPERYLKAAGNGILNPDPRAFTFGYGRRSLLAEDTLFIVVASVLSTMNISKAIDPDGSPIEPEVNYTTGGISHPGTFKCSIVARSMEKERLVLAMDCN